MRLRGSRVLNHALLTSAAFMILPGVVFAQAVPPRPTDDGVQIDEIVVTARKREETVQDVPATVGVVTAQRLAETGSTTLAELPSVAPGINLTQSPNSNEFGVTIRGLGSAPGNSSFDSSVSLFVDGVYAPRNREFAGAMFDLERIEVIRGTQAALLGKNTSLGAVNIVTRRPGSVLAGDLRVAREFEIGGDLVSGGVDLPLSDTVRVRLAGQYSDHDGPTTDVVTGRTAVRLQDAALRAVATWVPTDTLDATFFLQRNRVDNDGSPAEFIATNGVPELLQGLAGSPGTIETNLDRRNAASSPSAGGEQNGQLTSDRAALTVNYDLGDFTLTSLTGYSRMVSDANDDLDFQAGDYFYGDTHEVGKQFTQEIRLASPADDQLSYIVGALYLDGSLDITGSRTANYPFGPAPGVNISGAFASGFDQSSRAYSAFGQGVYSINDRFRVQAGLRYTNETKDVDLFRAITRPGFLSVVLFPPYAPFSLSHDEESLDYSLGVQYDLSEHANVYASYGQGTKSGGFASSVTLLEQSEYLKEVAHTAEIGLKMQGADRRWAFNVAAFNTEVSDFQLVTFTGLQFTIGNTDLQSRGVEFESYWYPLRGLRLFTTGTYADAEDQFTGRAPPLAPKVTASAGFSFDTPVTSALDLKIDGSVDHRSKRYYQQDPATSPAGEAFTTLNAGVALAGVNSDWELRLIGRNLTDENALSFAFPTPILPAGNQNGISEQPRTITLQLSLKY